MLFKELLFEEVRSVPPKVYPLPEDFDLFERKITNLGFREITRPEFRRDFIRLGLVAPTPRRGREVGFSFHANDLTVRVWTTWLREEESIREQDSGWVLISQNDQARYFCHPLHRTKNFFENLLRHAGLTRSRVLNRPLCPRCFYFMDITRGKGLGSRYWNCEAVELHENFSRSSLGWDYGLSEEEIKIAVAIRKERKRWRDEVKRSGKVVIPAILTRIGWQQTRSALRAS